MDGRRQRRTLHAGVRPAVEDAARTVAAFIDEQGSV
jgi:hypothetical protein